MPIIPGMTKTTVEDILRRRQQAPGSASGAFPAPAPANRPSFFDEMVSKAKEKLSASLTPTKKSPGAKLEVPNIAELLGSRPKLSKLKNEDEFKATPSPWSVVFGGLGKMLQARNNLDAANEALMQEDFSAKQRAEMEKVFNAEAINQKLAYEETSPAVQSEIEARQANQAGDWANIMTNMSMLPGKLQQQAARASGGGNRGGSGGPSSGPQTAGDWKRYSDAFKHFYKEGAGKGEADPEGYARTKADLWFRGETPKTQTIKQKAMEGDPAAMQAYLQLEAKVSEARRKGEHPDIGWLVQTGQATPEQEAAYYKQLGTASYTRTAGSLDAATERLPPDKALKQVIGGQALDLMQQSGQFPERPQVQSPYKPPEAPPAQVTPAPEPKYDRSEKQKGKDGKTYIIYYKGGKIVGQDGPID